MNYTIGPSDVVSNSFAGLDIKYEYVAWNYKKDSRQLWVIEYNWDVPDEEIKQVIAQRLAIFWFKEKTFEWAENFKKYIQN